MKSVQGLLFFLLSAASSHVGVGGEALFLLPKTPKDGSDEAFKKLSTRVLVYAAHFMLATSFSRYLYLLR